MKKLLAILIAILFVVGITAADKVKATEKNVVITLNTQQMSLLKGKTAQVTLSLTQDQLILVKKQFPAFSGKLMKVTPIHTSDGKVKLVFNATDLLSISNEPVY